MSSKENMINNLHKLYRADPWVTALFNSAGIEMDKISDLVDEIDHQLFFDTATETGLAVYEKELGITTREGISIADRRSTISAKWKMGGISSLELIQMIADSWHNGAVEVEFIGGKISVRFVSIYGIPTDLEGLQEAIGQIKPAHLAIYYTFKYRMHSQLTPFTHAQLAAYTHAQLRGEAQTIG